jgi:hypothetical protein
MNKSKLISALRTLTNKEFKRFESYIISPFFNKNEKVVELFYHVKKHHPLYPENKVSKEVIFSKLFPKEQLDEQKLRYVMTDLTKLLEEYLCYEEYDKNEIYKKHLLLNAYDNRSLEKYFQTSLEEADKQQKEQPYRDVNYFFNQHLIEANAYTHSLSRRPRAISSSLQEAVDNLDYYYLSNRLRYSCAILSREHLLQEKYNNLFLDQIFEFLSQTNLDHVPSVAIYLNIALTYLEFDNEEHYKKLIGLMDNYSAQFPFDEVKDIYTHAINYCLRKLNAGKEVFLSQLLDLYKVLLKKEIIFDNGYLTPNRVKNIVTAALRAGELEWTETFLKDYRERLDPEFGESTYVYNMANLYYHKKEFSKALKLMQTVEINDIYYHLGAKVLLLKTYFELDESEPFFSLVDAFTNYLKRNKLISDSQRTVNLNFVKYSKKLMQMRLGSKFSTDGIREELQNLKSIANLPWLHEKLEEIEKRKHDGNGRR